MANDSKISTINKERNHAIDIERGIAIILVIFGHISLTPSVLQNIFVVFNMPFFFIISGKVFSAKGSFKDFLIKKIKHILIPYFIMGFTLYLLEGMLDVIFGDGSVTILTILQGIPHNIVQLILGYRLTDYYYTMWFVMALFFVQIIMYFLVKIAKERWWAYLIISVIFYIAGWILIQYVQGFFFSLDLVPLGIGFFSIGLMAKCLKKNGVKYSSPKLIPLTAALALAAFAHNIMYGGGITFYAASGSQPVYTYFAAIFISWFIINICNNVGRNRILEYCGENSLKIYAYNNSFAIPLGKYILAFLIAHSTHFDDTILQWIIIFVIAFFTCLACAAIYNICERKIKSLLERQ